MKNFIVLLIITFSFTYCSEEIKYFNENSDLTELVEIRSNGKCKIKGKFIEEGTEEWERLCNGHEGKACCHHIADKTICCIYEVRAPNEMAYIDSIGDTILLELDTFITYPGVGPLSLDTITVGEDL